jgi:hypothetical protein
VGFQGAIIVIDLEEEGLTFGFERTKIVRSSMIVPTSPLVAERLIGSIRRECLYRVIVAHESNLH